MADNTPFAVRMDQEDKDKLVELIQESGKSNKEFMSSLISLYEVSKVKAKNFNLLGDIEQLEQQTSKINQIFINIIEKLEGQKASLVEENEKELQLCKDNIYNLKNEVDSLKSENSDLKDMFTNVNNVNSDLEKNMLQLENIIRDKIELIEEYKNKNDTLTGLLDEYKEFKGQIKEYEERLSEKNAELNEINNSYKEIKMENTGLLSQIELLKARHKDEIESLNKMHSQNLSRAIEKEAFDKEKALLAQDKGHQEAINKINDQHNVKIRELLQENEKYNDKVKKLIDEIEALRAAN